MRCSEQTTTLSKLLPKLMIILYSRKRRSKYRTKSSWYESIKCANWIFIIPLVLFSIRLLLSLFLSRTHRNAITFSILVTGCFTPQPMCQHFDWFGCMLFHIVLVGWWFVVNVAIAGTDADSDAAVISPSKPFTVGKESLNLLFMRNGVQQQQQMPWNISIFYRTS